jgi:hypothetical protein
MADEKAVGGVVYDPDDGVKTQDVVAGLRRASGTLVVELTPTGRTLEWLAGCFLDGLGMGGVQEDAPKSEALSWSFVVVWSVARRVSRIVVWRAHLLVPSRVDDIMRLGERLNAPITFIAQPTACSRGLNEAWLQRWALAQVSLDDVEFPEAAAVCLETVRDTPTGAREGSPPIRSLPDVDFTVFRSACRQELDAAAFAAVDAHYCGAAKAAVVAFSSSTVNEAWVFEQMVSSAAGLSVAEQVARVRGSQAGAFAAGWLVKVDMGKLLASLAEKYRRRTWTGDVAGRILRYRSPQLGAFGGILAYADCSVDEALRMVVSDVEERDGSVHIRVAGCDVTIGGAVALPVAAYACWRRGIATREDEPLWVSTYRGHAPLDKAGARAALRRFKALTGMSLGTLAHRSPTKAGWRYRHGLSVQRLAP